MKPPLIHPIFDFTRLEIESRADEYVTAGGAKIETELKDGIHAICEGIVTPAKGPHGELCYRFRTTNIPYLLYYDFVGEDVRILALVHPRRSVWYLRNILQESRSKE